MPYIITFLDRPGDLGGLYHTFPTADEATKLLISMSGSQRATARLYKCEELGYNIDVTLIGGA